MDDKQEVTDERGTLQLDRKQASLFNRTILAHFYLWIQSSLDEDGKWIPDVAMRLKTAGFNSKVINRFSNEEAKFLEELGEYEPFKKIRGKEFSFVVMTLEVARIWVQDMPKNQRPNINISDSKLLKGKHTYLLHLIELKNRDKEKYEEIKKIIEETAEIADEFYYIIKKFIKEHYHG